MRARRSSNGRHPGCVYLYEGRPGTGKTTIALQFLVESARLGERVLYVTLSETRRELELVVRRHGWSLEGIDVYELVPPEIGDAAANEVTVFHPSEFELHDTMRMIVEQIERFKPAWIVLDSLSELRLLAQGPLRYRRQVLFLEQLLTAKGCTAVLLDDLSSHETDLQLHSIAYGVLLLEQRAVDYGAERRRLRIIKMRGTSFRGGFHDSPSRLCDYFEGHHTLPKNSCSERTALPCCAVARRGA